MDPTPLIKSTSSLNTISRSFTGLSASISRASFLTRSIAKTINEDNRNKKLAISNDATFFSRRRQNILRRKREEQVEASGVRGVINQKGKVVKDTGKGFLGRILGFLGAILIGWVVTKLPAIIKGVQGLIKRIQQTVSVLKNFVDGIVDILEGMGRKFDEIIQFLNPFDFSKDKDVAEKQLKGAGEKIQEVNRGFIDSVNDFKDDSELDEIIKEIEEKRNRPWWDPLGVFDPKEGELTEQDKEDLYNESKSSEDKAWNDLTKKEQEEFLRKNTEIKVSEDEDIVTMNKGGELKKGESAIVGDDAKGKGKDRELFVPNQDGIIFPNNITEKLLEASSFLESKKLSSLKIGKEYDVNNPPNRGNYDKTVAGFRQFTKDFKQWIKDNPSGTKFGQKVEPSVEPIDPMNPMIESLKSVGDSLKPQMESVANELKEVIDTPEMQKTITNVKKSMQGVLKEITPERKGTTIMMPMSGGQSQSKASGGGITSIPSTGNTGGLNIKEYHKHLTTLITSYT